MKKLAVANQTTYVKEKLEERENRHHRHGRARYVLEPQYKGRQRRSARFASVILDYQTPRPDENCRIDDCQGLSYPH